MYVILGYLGSLFVIVLSHNAYKARTIESQIRSQLPDGGVYDTPSQDVDAKQAFERLSTISQQLATLVVEEFSMDSLQKQLQVSLMKITARLQLNIPLDKFNFSSLMYLGFEAKRTSYFENFRGSSSESV